MKAPALALALILIALTSSFTLADDRRRDLSTELSGYNEVHFVFSAGPPASAALRGAVSTNASGKFKARIDDDLQTIHYELTYKNLQGNVTQAHIHFGQRHTVGGIVVWLCETAANPAPDTNADLRATPTCPGSGTVAGMIRPGQVLALNEQGMTAGDFGELVRAIRAGATYVNVHSVAFPPGEIRGHLDHRGHGDRD